MCNAIKATSCKPLAIPNLSKLESLMKEWRVRLGDVNKEKRINRMNNQLVKGITYVDKMKMITCHAEIKRGLEASNP
ncbi:Hypothetical protein PHPALM_3470 [Phytophthora palmivora]|uniref:Uncharacterized protein n=1 Tax=Phytophthora palmivora TaxID=4796 RepID=A0A2P4YMB3_9STRA|nr:Hypothetical protein PHPALM_3470 [Phytophthora palmivora]